MLDNANAKIARYKELKAKMILLKTEADEIEVEFLKAMESDLEDTKYKTISYHDDSGNTVKATTADTVKLIYPSMLKDIFGKAYSDVVTEETTYKLSAQAKRLLAGLYKKEYLESDVDALIDSMCVDEDTKKMLIKKIKGKNFDTDVKNLIKFAGMDEQTAKENAYLLSEIVTWQELIRLLQINNETVDKEIIKKALTWIDSAVVVEETPKIAFSFAE